MTTGTKGVVVATRANSGSEDFDEVRPGARFGPEGDEHELGDELGSGVSGRVFACKRVDTGEDFAVKVIDLDRFKLLGDVDMHVERLDREVTILRKLQHERVVQLCMLHRTERFYFIVMERIWGGELFNEIVRRKFFTEQEARHIFLQLLEGISYMHSKCVIHRDMKPENILITRTVEAPDGGILHDVKIADFGLSKLVSEGASMAKTVVGTPQYWAPEVLNADHGGGSYDQAADFWGLGAMLFVVLCGKYPFDGKKMPMERQIRTGAVNSNVARWKQLSGNAQDIIRGLLQVDPSQRMGLEECLRHPWVASANVSLSLTTTAATGHPTPSQKSITGNRKAPALAPTPEGVAGEEEPSPVPSRDKRAESAQTEAGGSVESVSPTTSATVVPASPALVLQPLSAGRNSATDAWNMKYPRLEDKVHHDDQDAHRGQTTKVESPTATALWSPPASEASRWAAVKAALDQGGLTSPPAWQGAGAVSPPEVARWAADPMPSRQIGGGGAATLENFAEQPKGNLPVTAVWQSPRNSTGRELATTPTGQASMASAAPWQWLAEGSSQPFVGASASDAVDAAGIETYADREVGIRLDDLLKLQASIVGALHLAFYAMRQTDPELADATRRTFREARDLFHHAADVVARFSDHATEVVSKVLPDLEMAVDEKIPDLAKGLLSMVQDWINQMKEEGRGIQRRYGSLQESVEMLERQARLIHGAVDHRLADLVHAAAFQATSPMNFWEYMDDTVRKLTLKQDHAQQLVNHTDREKVKERFGERIDEYASFWKSLERLCRQYAHDHLAASRRMAKFVQEVNACSDRMDAVELAAHTRGGALPIADTSDRKALLDRQH